MSHSSIGGHSQSCVCIWWMVHQKSSQHGQLIQADMMFLTPLKTLTKVGG